MKIKFPLKLTLPSKKSLLPIGIYTIIVLSVGITLYIVADRIQTRSIPTGSISLSTEYSKYIVGEEVRFKLTNNYNGTIYVNNQCPQEPLEVYKLEDSKWIRVHSKSQKTNCDINNRQIAIPPKATVISSFKQWDDLFTTPGTYRIATYVEYYNSIPYGDFEIVEKPPVPELPALLPDPGTTTPARSSTTQDQTSNSPSQNSSPSTPAPAETPTTQKIKTITVANGTITADYTNGSIDVTSVNPPSGYTYETSSGRTSTEITFKKPGQEIQIKLRIVNGELTYSVEYGD